MKREYRLRKNEDFQKVIQKRKSIANASFALYWVKNSLDQPRIGISVSSKLGKAVIRNKIKRQVRMMVLESMDFTLTVDLVLMVRKGYLNKNYADNLVEIQSLYRKLSKEVKKEV